MQCILGSLSDVCLTTTPESGWIELGLHISRKRLSVISIQAIYGGCCEPAPFSDPLHSISFDHFRQPGVLCISTPVAEPFLFTLEVISKVCPIHLMKLA
jgi:hypothetical protein